MAPTRLSVADIEIADGLATALGKRVPASQARNGALLRAEVVVVGDLHLRSAGRRDEGIVALGAHVHDDAEVISDAGSVCDGRKRRVISAVARFDAAIGVETQN